MHHHHVHSLAPFQSPIRVERLNLTPEKQVILKCQFDLCSWTLLSTLDRCWESKPLLGSSLGLYHTSFKYSLGVFNFPDRFTQSKGC